MREGGTAAGELASWNDGAARRSIVSFGERTTRAGSPDHVEPDARHRSAARAQAATLEGEAAGGARRYG